MLEHIHGWNCLNIVCNICLLLFVFRINHSFVIPLLRVIICPEFVSRIAATIALQCRSMKIRPQRPHGDVRSSVWKLAWTSVNNYVKKVWRVSSLIIAQFVCFSAIENPTQFSSTLCGSILFFSLGLNRHQKYEHSMNDLDDDSWRDTWHRWTHRAPAWEPGGSFW